MNDKILQELSKPFSPSRITWRAGAVKGDKTKAMALAYADPRAYMERLDAVCGIDWAVSYTPWGERIICHVTINGMTRSSTGEPDSDSERNELSGTVAEAQAFKRACTMFGLGRYLYEFDSPWVEFDGKNFTAQAKAKLDGMVAAHYKRVMSEAEHRNPKASAGNNVYISEPIIPDDLEQDIDMGMGVVDVARLSKGWPYDEDALAYMLQHARLALPELSKKMAHWYMLEDSASGDKRLSEKQYGLLTGKLDNKYGKDTHRAILSTLCNRVVTGEDAPGWKCKVLIDWLMDEASNAQKIQALDGVAIALRATLSDASGVQVA